ncbi:DUF3558 domain-containing protein [Goodfellowiella coeruleoviolacea]|uniref:DUF3558 domain-containing protein n=1 Tax=Goodfellowiella coeruleoviolacea TaxID=334858 RepID=A0AAE3GF18_9PSEU|nr:DUF3558 domain-containing protein [Goodfellowiella coeruleoviolacea]MCP2166140.1 Protein of unknown function (DUF3558) [Goodfellowiella coeruleoviolacea]
MRSPWQRLAISLATVAVPALVIAGCSSGTGGTPSAEGGSTSTASSGTTKSSGSTSSSGKSTPTSGKSSVSRPKNIDLTGVDPCSLVTPEFKTVTGSDREPKASTNPDQDNAPTCGVTAGTSGTANASVALLAKGIGQLGAPGTKTEIAGFPAELRKPTNGVPGCAIVVDVADAQALLVNMTSFDAPQDELCQKVPQLAESAMGALVNR